MGNFKEEQDSANNQIERLLKTLITSSQKLDTDSVLNIEETFEIRNLLSKFGDIPNVVTQKVQESCDAIAKDRNIVAGPHSGEKGTDPRVLGGEANPNRLPVGITVSNKIRGRRSFRIAETRSCSKRQNQPP